MDKTQTIPENKKVRMDNSRIGDLGRCLPFRLIVKLTTDHVTPWSSISNHPLKGNTVWVFLSFYSKIQMPKPKYCNPRHPLITAAAIFSSVNSWKRSGIWGLSDDFWIIRNKNMTRSKTSRQMMTAWLIHEFGWMRGKKSELHGFPAMSEQPDSPQNIIHKSLIIFYIPSCKLNIRNFT